MNLAKHSQMTDKKLTCGFTSTCAMASRYILKTLRTRMSPLSLGSPECRRRVPYALYLFLTFSFITLQTFNSFSQGGAAINTTGASSDPSAMLDVSSTNQGILIPNVALASTTDGTTISNPAKSLLIYNTGSSGLTPAGYYYNQGTTVAPNWVPLITNNVNTAAAWSLTGNTGTTAGTNFLGTTDNKDFVFKTNNTEWARITSGGNVGIGTTAPESKLDVNGLIRTRRNSTPTQKAGGVILDETIADYYHSSLHSVQPSGGIYESRFSLIGPGQATSHHNKFSIGWYSDNTLVTWNNIFMVDAITGRVGIGTTSPTSDLQIQSADSPSISGTSPSGALSITTGFNTNSTALTLGVEQNGVAGSTYNGWMQMRNSGADGLAYDMSLQPLGGKVGIGTTTPDNILDVNGTLEVGNGTRGFQLYSSAADNFSLYSYANTPNTNWFIGSGNGTGGPSTTTAYIVSNISYIALMSANVGIGTASPASALHITPSTGVTIGEDKTGSANTAGTIKYVSAGNNAYYTTFTAGTQTANANYTLPTADGANGQVLSTNGSGTLSWVSSFPCGVNFTVAHIAAGGVAPVDKTITYGTILSALTGSAKCWITQNLGAITNAASANESTEPNAGWYWQFNLKQGYKHDGSTRTPATTWISSINEDSNWLAANDPCTLELGAGWRIPTYTEWNSADANGKTGGWDNYNETYADVLKLHAAGNLDYSNGSLANRGTLGYYWTSNQLNAGSGGYLTFSNSSSNTNNNYSKTHGFSLRCLRE